MFLSACASSPPIRTVEYVDLDRFMGDWYVIANIPTFIEKGAHNAVESYAIQEDGTIATTFTFNADDFDGKLKQYNPRGFIRDRKSNAVWGMQFIWPIKAEYRIIYLNKEYTHTIIGRSKRNYVWIMARTPSVSDEDYQSMISLLSEAGYDVARIQKVPQRWE
jgi:apolipoprotein D and lipocalin family protein